MPVSYILKRSRRKTMTIRIVDHQVYVDAPILTSKLVIDNFVQSHQSWIDKKLATVRKKASYDLANDSEVYLLGKRYDLCILTNQKNSIAIEDDRLILQGKSINSISTNFRKYLTGILQSYVDEIKKQLKIDFTIEYRFYKSKWGCCYQKKRLIILNVYLAAVEPAVIEQVIYHEIAHLKVANHQKAFYEELARMCPDYKAKVSILKQYTL